LNLLDEIKKTFKVPIIVAINKIDIDEEGYNEEVFNKIDSLKDKNIVEVLRISTKGDINLDSLKKRIVEIIKKHTDYNDYSD